MGSWLLHVPSVDCCGMSSPSSLQAGGVGDIAFAKLGEAQKSAKFLLLLSKIKYMVRKSL